MVRVLREQHGKRCEPNGVRPAQIAVPVASAWRAACAANTVESYTKFKEVWPAHSWHAEQQIKEIKYPLHVRKLVSSFGWIMWGALFALIVGISLRKDVMATHKPWRRAWVSPSRYPIADQPSAL